MEDTAKTRRQREVERLEKLVKQRPETDEGFDFQGVLLSDAIERCVTAFKLIEPFNPENLKAACYKLTVGDEYALGGQMHTLSDHAGANEIRIRSFEVAVIKTHETINMPRFLIGRWNIQVSRAYEGLVWVGGPQVDAGYVGHLFCPIYNRVLFEEYEPKKLISGLVRNAKERLDEVESKLKTNFETSEKEIRSIQKRVDSFISLTFAIVAILFAAISVAGFGKAAPPWEYISVFLLSGFSIFLAAAAWQKSSSERSLFGRLIQALILLGITAAFVVQVFWIHDQQTKVDELSRELRGVIATTKTTPPSVPMKAGPTAPRAPKE